MTMTIQEKIWAVPSEEIKTLYKKAYTIQDVYKRLKVTPGKMSHDLLKLRFAEEGLDPEKFVKLQNKRRAVVCQLANEITI